MSGEFALINELFAGHDHAPGIALGVGDDCALIRLHGRKCLAVTTDTMVEGRHFFPGTDPYYLGWRALAVNLSDLAAMGAKPYCCTMSLTLPDGSREFLDPFAQGFFDLAAEEGVALIGGNMSKGPLSITIEAFGKVREDRAMLRSGAKPGDNIYVTGGLGTCGLYVKSGNGEIELSDDLQERCYKHSFILESRTTFARKLSRWCSCAVDISDGIVGDLRHILEQSNVGAELHLDQLPLAAVLDCRESAEKLTFRQRCEIAAYGGCDYELLFTLPAESRLEERMCTLAWKHKVPICRVGTIVEADEREGADNLQLFFEGRPIKTEPAFEHF